jgi:hypothetical protein
MTTPLEVARWMRKQINNTGHLDHEYAAGKILNKFGEDFAHINVNGNYDIDKNVLKVFRDLTEPTVVWERGLRIWRKRESYDTPGKRQAD